MPPEYTNTERALSFQEPPCFYRLLPHGIINVQAERYSNWNGMDFSLTKKMYLVLSEKAMNILKDFQLKHADITEILL